MCSEGQGSIRDKQMQNIIQWKETRPKLGEGGWRGSVQAARTLSEEREGDQEGR